MVITILRKRQSKPRGLNAHASQALPCLLA